MTIKIKDKYFHY